MTTDTLPVCVAYHKRESSRDTCGAKHISSLDTAVSSDRVGGGGHGVLGHMGLFSAGDSEPNNVPARDS